MRRQVVTASPPSCSPRHRPPPAEVRRRTPESSTATTGPIKIWLSNNPEEIAWGKAMVEAWNADHPDEKVTAQEIPAGKTSEEVIGAAITAGNAPCLVFNTSPAAVPAVREAGRPRRARRASTAARDYIEERTGDAAEQYQSPDGQYYQIPWKSNPVMIFYNKDIFDAGRPRPGEPAARDVRRVPRDQPHDRRQRCRRGGHLAVPGERVLPVLVRLLPAVRRRERRHSSWSRTARRRSTPRPGKAVADFWATMYDEGLSPKETYNGDSFADGKAAMAIVGPWAIAVYGDKVNWGVVPVPTSAGTSPEEIYTFSDAKNIGLYSACENQGTAWEVLEVRDQRGAGRPAPRADRPDAAAHRPGRRPTPTTSRRTRSTTTFADQAVAHRRGAQRAELDRDLAGVPRRLDQVGDLRQEHRRRGARRRRRQGHRARRPVLRVARRP